MQKKIYIKNWNNFLKKENEKNETKQLYSQWKDRESNLYDTIWSFSCMITKTDTETRYTEADIHRYPMMGFTIHYLDENGRNNRRKDKGSIPVGCFVHFRPSSGW